MTKSKNTTRANQVKRVVSGCEPIARISGARFTFQKWCGANMMSIFELWDFDEHEPKPEFVAIGYCDGDKPVCRPGHGKYAVMLERVTEDGAWKQNRIGEKFWLHVDYLNKAEWRAKIDGER
jgi:hypothetical protein